MKTIHKYILEITDHQIIQLPIGYKILSVQEQGNKICMWVIVDKEEVWKEDLGIWIFETGHDMTSAYNGEFLGTVQLAGGSLVLHVFRDKD